jgi:DNA topoisomerase-3
MEPLERMLMTLSRRCSALILWLDCDREGEAISDEVRTVCLKGNSRLGPRIYRAKFSTVLPQEIRRALRSLGRVNENFVKAVQARSEHDLRVGAAFTRFQTLRLQKKFDGFLSKEHGGGVVSYGPCQFPTLGFVVERWARIETFRPEDFWFLEMTIRLNEDGSVVNDTGNGGPVNNYNSGPQGRAIRLNWKRTRLYDKLVTLALYDACLDAGQAVVTSLTGRPKNKWRPVPLATVELQKRASKYLRIGSEELMQKAEELYQQGFISYPRTETEKFRPEFNHYELIQSFQAVQGEFGNYANRLLSDNNFQNPRAGQNDDNAHPPITPAKAVDPESINDPIQRKIYSLVVKHYLACCSRDAVGRETELTLKIASEEFVAKGLMILERNWLDIYQPWERWSTGQGELPKARVGTRIVPTSLVMNEGQTTPPQAISEVELIALMDKNGIGTDATM